MSTAAPAFAASISAMAERYPSLKFRLENRDGKAFAIWEDWLQPIRTKADLNSIVCDLDANRPVLIDLESSSIKHDPHCIKEHKTHRILNAIKRWDRPFLVRIEFDGGPAHPRAYLLDPVVTPKTRYHIFGENRICAYAPQSDVWRAADHTVADFTDHVLVWLFKWNTWVETKYWLGAEEDHRPLHLLSTIRPHMQCWCGSGLPYGKCCMPGDKIRAESEMQNILQKRSRFLQKPDIDLSALKTLPAFLLKN